MNQSLKLLKQIGPLSLVKLSREMASKNLTVVIEGNIGSGKTEMLEYLRRFKEFDLVSEPIEKWRHVENTDGNLLQLFYADPHRWCLPFQSYVQLTTLQTHMEAQTRPIGIMERSLFSARHCFVENLYRSRIMTEWEFAVLDAWYRELRKLVHVDLIIYLRNDPATCLEQIRHRGRAEESGISLEYLQQLHDLHEEWLVTGKRRNLPTGAKVVTLDANRPLAEMKGVYDEQRENLLKIARHRLQSAE